LKNLVPAAKRLYYTPLRKTPRFPWRHIFTAKVAAVARMLRSYLTPDFNSITEIAGQNSSLRSLRNLRVLCGKMLWHFTAPGKPRFSSWKDFHWQMPQRVGRGRLRPTVSKPGRD
jgi:hypothetical protein